MRSPTQIRTETVWHEAAHAAAGYLLGYEISRITVAPEEAQRDLVEDIDAVGSVYFADREIVTLADAINEIVIYLAGEAGTAVSWALGVITDQQIGGMVIPDSELTIEAALAGANGRTPAQQGASFAFYRADADHDMTSARAIAEAWTRDGLEAELLLSFCRMRTANIVNTERFQRLQNSLAVKLMDTDEIHGAWASRQCYIADFATDYAERTTPLNERTIR